METACMACSTSMMIVDTHALSFIRTLLPARQCQLSPAVVACARRPHSGGAHACENELVLPWRAAPTGLPLLLSHTKPQTERRLPSHGRV